MDVRFIGRDGALQEIRDHLLHIMSGQPRIVLLEGQAGVGKSRFLQEIRLMSHALDARIYQGYATDTFSRPYAPYDALLPALQADGAFRHDPPSATAQLPMRSSGVVSESDFERAQSDQIQFMREVADAVAALAQESPVTVIIDDLHLADPASLQLFTYLAGVLVERRDTPVLLLGSFRPQPAGTPLGGLLNGLRKQPITRELQLSGFHELETRAFIETFSQQAATQQLVDRIQRVTQGVPFFVEQLLLLLVHQGSLIERGDYLVLQDTAMDDVELPQTPEGMIGPRLDSLSASVCDCLTLGAFLLEPFSAQKLASVAQAQPSQVEEAIKSALDHGIVVGERESLQFAHALVRQVLQNRLSLPERRQAHLAIAGALEWLYGESQDLHILEIAHHVVEAGALVDADLSIAVTQQAGDRAMQVYAWSEAARYYEAALSAAEPRRGQGQVDLARYYYQAGLAHHRNQDASPAQVRFKQAAQAYENRVNPVGLALALMWLTQLEYMNASPPRGVLPHHAQRLSEVLGQLGTSETNLRGYLMAALSLAYQQTRQPAEANDLGHMALRIGRETGDLRLVAKAGSALGLSTLGRLQIEPAIKILTETVDTAHATHDLIVENTAISDLAHALHLKGSTDAAQARACEGEEGTRSLQDWGIHSKCLSHLAGAAAVRGEFAAVEQLGQAALVMAKRAHYPWGAYRALQTWAFALAVRGFGQEADDVLDMIAEPGVIFTEPDDFARLLTRVFKELGRFYRDENTGEKISSLCREFIQVARRDTYSLGPLCATIELADSVMAPSFLEKPVAILSFALESGALFTSGWVFCIPRILGVAAVLREDWDTAVGHFIHAFHVTRESDAWPEYGRTCLDFARLIRLNQWRQHYPNALKAAEEAIEVLGELGMSRHVRFGIDLHELLTSDSVIEAEEEDSHEEGPQNQNGASQPE